MKPEYDVKVLALLRRTRHSGRIFFAGGIDNDQSVL